MAGRNATTTGSLKNSCLRRNTAVTVAKRSVYAQTKSLRLQYFRRTGRRMRWYATTRKNFRSVTVTACSSLSMGHGTERLIPKVVITLYFSRYRTATHPGSAKYLQMVLREQ